MNQMDITKYVKNLEGRNVPAQTCELVRSDLDYGLSEEQVEMYLEKKFDYGQQKQISKAFRNQASMEFVKMMIDSGLNHNQMEVIMDFFMKGVPVDALTDAAKSGQQAMGLKKALHQVYEKMQEANVTVNEEPAYAKELMEEITKVVSSIQDNRTYYECVEKKLDSLDEIKKVEDVKAEYEKQLSEQQDLVNKAKKEANDMSQQVVELKEQISVLKEEKLMQAEQLTDLEKEKSDMVREMRKIEDELEEAKSRPRVQSMTSTNENTASSQMNQTVAASTSTGATGATVASTAGGVPIHYQTRVVDQYGNPLNVRVERNNRKKNPGMLDLASRTLFKSKTSKSLVQQLIGKGLNAAQMEQIRIAIESGLDEDEVVDIINSGFSAEEMAQAIQIVVADKMY